MFIVLCANFQDFVFQLLTRSTITHTLLFSPGFERYRWYVGKWRALRTYEFARREVPAYKNYLQAHHVDRNMPIRLLMQPQITTVPEMDKELYIKKYSIEDRCVGGRLPREGVVVDESSGSSGKPTSWVRNSKERQLVRSILQLSFIRGTKRRKKLGHKPIFVLNAFSLGAWATGMNVSMSLIDLCIMKSTGPDMDKIIQTIEEFGEDYTYVIMGYPPFLKNLVDDERIDLSKYDAIAGFGGEGMSENMRAYLLRHFKSVYGSYGASDLEINIAAETEFAVKMRQILNTNEDLAKEVINTSYGVLPMVFQYNPYEYVIETNEKGELLVTIGRKNNLSPRIRYNIHDRGHVWRLKDLQPILKKHGLGDLIKEAQLDFPLLLHYGRSDLSVDFYGAVVTPDSIREIIYGIDKLSSAFSNYRLISYEDKDANKQLHIAVELKPNFSVSDFADLGEQIIAKERDKNRDFNNACKIAKASTLPTIKFYKKGEGPFAFDKGKLKNEYVWHLAYEQVRSMKLDLG